MIIANNMGNNQPNICEVMTNSLPDTWLNNDNNVPAANNAIAVAAIVTKMDSVKNWAIKYLRGDPNTLRTPTSRARFDERAVERFMKFTQAISKMNMATAEKIYTYS